MAGEIVRSPQGGGVDVTFAQQRLARAAGNLSGFSEIIDQAQQKICSLYNKSPASLVTVVPITEIFNPGQGILDNTCQDIAPLPPLPAPQFSGGQCDGVPYFVTVTTVKRGFYTGDGRLSSITETGTIRLNAPIRSAYVSLPGSYTEGGVTNQGFSRLIIECKGDSGIPSANVFPYVFGGSQNFEFQSISLGNIVRADGQPDLCGNPPPSYPPPSATVPDMEGTTIINVRPNVPITVPVKIVPTFAPITSIFRPEFNVEVGGINVNISLGGFTLTPTVNVPVNVNVPLSDPRGVNVPAPVAISPPCETAPPVNLSPVIDLLNQVKAKQEECCEDLKPADDDDPVFINKTVSTLSLESATVTLPEGTYKVRVLLTERSTKEKIQSGGTEADVIYAGWGWFGSGFSLAERLPIDSIDKQFVPPNSLQNSFTFTCYVGYKAICTVYYKEKR